MAKGEFYTLLALTGNGPIEGAGHTASPVSVLMMIYLTGMVLMLLRYSVNVIRLVLKTKQGSVVAGPSGPVILTDDEGLPYSFFRHIFINRKIYESGEHLEELLLHETVHGHQAHSADILFAEFMKMVQWYNPFAWLIVRAIRLNHEYLADEQVLESRERNAYQLLLVNMELANQSNFLASDFKNSYTIKRITMMDKTNHRKNSVIGKLATLSLFLFLALVMSFCEVEHFQTNVPKRLGRLTRGANIT
ncbi:MAG: M56 family metallopeptidase [Anaerolineales bacterium]